MLSSAELWDKGDLAAAVDSHYAQEIYQALSRRRQSTAEGYLLSGLAAYRAHDIARAAGILRAGHRQFPDDPKLVDNYLRVGLEVEPLDRLLDHVDPAAAGPACERLAVQSTDWNLQVGLIGYLLRTNMREAAEARIKNMIDSCDSVIPLWLLSDLLLANGRRWDADRIYKNLSLRVPDSPEAALYSALSHERLLALDTAIAALEVAALKYPEVAYLRQHLVRLRFATGDIAKVIEAEMLSGVDDYQACLSLFARYPDSFSQAKLVEYCLTKGYVELAESKLTLDGSGPLDTASLWNVTDFLETHGRSDRAREIRLALIDRPRTNALDAYYAALAALRLDDMERCLSLLEEGQIAFPTSPDLHSLYLQLCASRVEYERYAAFINRRNGGTDSPVLSVEDFYRAALNGQATETFILNYKDIQRLCSPDSFAQLCTDVLESLKVTTLPTGRIKVLLFFARYLDLEEDFARSLWDVLKDQASELAGPGGDVEREQRTLEMLYRLTPAMIPEWGGHAGQMVDGFIKAARALARRPVRLVEPITDMSNNWTPWQYIFCSGAVHKYSDAIAALEQAAFKAWPKLNHVAPHLSGRKKRARPNRRIRIGFIVHDSMPMMSGLLAGLDPARFETVFLRPGNMGTSRAARNWVQRAERVVQYADLNTFSAIDTIAAEELDIIVCGPSVAGVFFPMMARLAHLQMVLLEPNWTDGLKNADYYISWRAAEPDRYGDFYRTKVALLDHPPYYLERHAVDGQIPEDARLELRQRLFGAGASGRIYLCANTPPKIHPDMDEMFLKLLQRDPTATLVVLRGEYPPSKTLKLRLHRKLGPLAERVVFLPTLKQEDAHRLLLAVDCCLDSFPLCGMSSSFDAAMLGVPIVTLASNLPFGKWTATIYDYIGVSGLTAGNQDEYIEIALRLARDPVRRKELAAELREKSSRFVESQASVRVFADFIALAWARHEAGLPPADFIGGDWLAEGAEADTRPLESAATKRQMGQRRLLDD